MVTNVLKTGAHAFELSRLAADRMALSELPHPISVKRFPFATFLWNSLEIAVLVTAAQLPHLLDGRLRFRPPAVPRRKGAILFVTHFPNDAYPSDYRTNVSNDVGRKFWSIRQWAVILPLATNAFASFLCANFFLTIPRELIEAARIDGANQFHYFLEGCAPL